MRSLNSDATLTDLFQIRGGMGFVGLLGFEEDLPLEAKEGFRQFAGFLQSARNHLPSEGWKKV